MLYAILCTDKPNHLETRKANRDAHLAYLAETGAVLAGPFLDEDGAMTGSMVVIEAETLAAAEAWAEADPFAKAGLFDRVDIKAWKRVIG